MDISIVIPARNEELTIYSVVCAAKQHSAVKEIIVVDNASTDRTQERAISAGATVVECPKVGLGYAMKAGVAKARSRYILRSDADIDNWQPDWIELLLPSETNSLTRGIYRSPYSQLPMSNYVVRPYLELFKPEWAHIPIPTTGTYLFDRNNYNFDLLPNNWAIDIAILFRALETHPEKVKNILIGTLSDRQRQVPHYIQMATDLASFMMCYFKASVASLITQESIQNTDDQLGLKGQQFVDFPLS